MALRLHLVVLIIITVLFDTGSSFARTWYVAADGSGDAPTIAAAIDSSMAGDLILVGPGTHAILSAVDSGVILKPNTSLMSEMGPMATSLVPGAGPLQPGLVSLADNCVVGGFTMSGGQSSTMSALGENTKIFDNIVVGQIVILGACEFHNNFVREGFVGIDVLGGSGISIHNNIIFGDVVSTCSFGVFVTCNLIQGDQSCSIAYNNFNADPLFCGVGNYYLRSDSPCAPGNHPDGAQCGQIGPLPIGCGAVSVRETSWGAVKALYRN